MMKDRLQQLHQILQVNMKRFAFMLSFNSTQTEQTDFSFVKCLLICRPKLPCLLSSNSHVVFLSSAEFFALSKSDKGKEYWSSLNVYIRV